MNRKIFGQRIRELRKQRHFSQQELADACRMNLRTVQRIEAGTVEPRSYTLRQFEKALKCKFGRETTKCTTDLLYNFFSKIRVIFNRIIYGGIKNMNRNNFLQQLRKSAQDKKIAGICGGLGEHTTVPGWVWRVMFLFFTMLYGSGLIAYMVLWIFMPEAQADVAQQKQNMGKKSWLNRFNKSEKDKKLGGICGGLGECTSVPSWTWRTLFVCGIFIYGAGIVLYLLLWIFVPKGQAQSTGNLSMETA